MKTFTIFKTAFLFLLIAGFQLLAYKVSAQSPESFSYQAVVRNASGNIIANQSVKFRISVLIESTTGSSVYSETHSLATNAYGLANLNIGSGITLSGSFASINWDSYKHYLKVEIDPAGGDNFTNMGITQLLSVPYALHAKTVEIDEVNDADADAGNELQTLSLSGTQLSLSDGGGTITLPSGSNSLWRQNGSAIYYSNNVGIGTNSPAYELDIADATNNTFARISSNGTSGLLLNRGGVSDYAYLLFQTGGTSKFYAGLMASGNFKISSSNTQTQGVEVEPTGNVRLTHNLYVDGITRLGKLGKSLTVEADGDVRLSEDLSVIGKTKLGLTGTPFSEIVEITGLTAGAGYREVNIAYPIGFNSINTRVLSLEFYYGGAWVSIGTIDLRYKISDTGILIKYSGVTHTVINKPLRMILMKM